LPLLVELSHFLIVRFILQFAIYDINANAVVVTGNLLYVYLFLNYFQWAAFIVILLVYPPYPAPYSVKRYFLERGFRTAVLEYEFVKKVLLIAVPLLIVFVVIIILHDLEFPPHQNTLNANPENKVKSLPEPFHSFSVIIHPNIEPLNYAKILLVLIVISGILKMTFALARRDFRLYFAKGCFVIIQSKHNEADKMRYFVMGMNSYNLYLRRQIKLEINDLKKIYSKIATAPSNKRNELMEKIMSIFFTDKKLEDSTLEPLQELANFMGEPETTVFLTQQSLINKLRDWGAIAAVIVPLIIAVVNLFSKSPFFKAILGG
jgi:VanZ family protein